MKMMQHQIIDKDSRGCLLNFDRAAGKSVAVSNYIKEMSEEGKSGFYVYERYSREGLLDNLQKLEVDFTFKRSTDTILFSNGSILKLINIKSLSPCSVRGESADYIAIDEVRFLDVEDFKNLVLNYIPWVTKFLFTGTDAPQEWVKLSRTLGLEIRRDNSFRNKELSECIKANLLEFLGSDEDRLAKLGLREL